MEEYWFECSDYYLSRGEYYTYFLEASEAGPQHFILYYRVRSVINDYKKFIGQKTPRRVRRPNYSSQYFSRIVPKDVDDIRLGTSYIFAVHKYLDERVCGPR